MNITSKKFFIEELGLNTHTKLNLFKKNNIFPLMKDATVIDIGCGTGFFSSLISQYAKKLICLDISEDNIKQTKSLLQSNNVQYLVSDCKKLNLSDSEIDVVFCSATIEHFEYPVISLSEFHRILRPGGKLVLTVEINPRITGFYRNIATFIAEKLSNMKDSHPEVHKQSVFSDKRSRRFIDMKKLKNHLAKDYELLVEDYGGGILSNIIDSSLVLINALGKPKDMKGAANLSDHYSRLDNPLIRCYIKGLLPTVKVVAKIDNYKIDAFVALLIYEKVNVD